MKKPAPQLDQLPLFNLKQRGGKRAGAGRKKGSGSVTIRIPTTVLKSVTEIKNGTHTPEKTDALKSVTEIKDDESAAQAIRALREYFRTEYMMGESDIAFETWIKNNLEQTAAREMTTHTVQYVWSCADGYIGASDYGYKLTPPPRGSNHRHLDESWLSPSNKPKRSK